MQETISHYRIDEKLGSGGMGDVYLATDLILGRQVAVKTIQPKLLADAAAESRFMREARAIAALNHPSIAVLYEVGKDGDLPFLAMEFVEGRTLREELSGAAMPLEKLLSCATQIASALEHAHAKGILHRDIKAANIIINREGVAKLLDFGLAKSIAAAEETMTEVSVAGTFVGTLHYSAPEILSNHPATVKTDIYSLGVVLYEMACGQLPFAGMQAHSLVAGILRGSAIPVAQRNPSIPAGLVRVIEKAMHVVPAQRYTSAAEMLRDLRSVGSTGAPEVAAAPAELGLPVLAVLDFQNISGDPSVDWLGTGLAETISADLKKVKLVRVVNRERTLGAVRALGGDVSGRVVDLGKILGARWIVKGSYQRAGNRLRITPQLHDVFSEDVVSIGKVDGDWDDVFTMQDRVVTDLMAALHVSVDTSAMSHIATPETLRIEAYEEYAQGRKLSYSLSKEGLEQARLHYERAVELDPEYALACAALGATYTMRFIHRTDPEDHARAITWLERALQLDPDLGEPHTWLCYVYARQGRIEEAVTAGRLGLKRQPDVARSAYLLGVTYLIAAEASPDRYALALETFRKAIDLESRNQPANMFAAWIGVIDGRYDKAQLHLDHSAALLALGPQVQWVPGAETIAGTLELRRSRFANAERAYQKGLEFLRYREHIWRDAFVALCACGLGDARLRLGNLEAAASDYRLALRVIREYPRMMGRERILLRGVAGLAAALASEDRPRAEQFLREGFDYLSRAEQTPQSWLWEASLPQLLYAMAVACGRLDDWGGALGVLEKCAQRGWRDASWLENDPEWNAVRHDPRFSRIVEQVKAVAPLPWEDSK